MAKEWYFLLAKHCLQEFKLDCQLRRLTDRTIKGYYNNTLNFLTYAEKHHGITEVEEIHALHIKHYIQYLLTKKLTATYINSVLKCLRAFFRFAIQEEYVFSNPTQKVKMQKEPKVLIKTFNDDEVRSLLSVFDYSSMISKKIKELREQAGYSQSQLAKKLDVTRSSVNAWEMGLSMPTTQYVIAMTKLFHVPADYLLGTDSDMTISLRGYSEKEISLILNLLRYFDGER